MTGTLLAAAVLAAQILLVGAMGCAALRALLGPRAQDRVLALDALSINAAMLMLVFGIRSGADHYFHAALLITLIGFVATAALSKFLLRGEVIE
jgi:multicomponent K+:H+ antiporter subunit F